MTSMIEREGEILPSALRWEYKADNLKKIPGMALENKMNERGQEGWEFVAVADNYAIFNRYIKVSS